MEVANFRNPFCECGNYKTLNTDRCESCNRYARKLLESIQKDTVKTKKMLKTKIKHRSSKRQKQEAEYSRLRPLYLEENPFCKVDGCRKIANQVHHKAGRIGYLLLHVPWWLAVCEKCHPKIEENPEWAKAKGYSLNRI